MGYWGWRPLILGLFMSTWVAGCNIDTEPASPSTLPTTYPSVTLTVGRFASPRAAPTRAAITTYISPSGIPLVFENPTCYETREDTRLCLGLISNPLNYAVESVVIEVQLSSLTELVTIEQAIIPPGGFAPYQATFDTRLSLNGMVRLVSAGGSTDDNWVTLATQQVEAQKLNDGRFVITAQVINRGDTLAAAIRAVVVMLDDENHVIGYRVVTFEGEGEREGIRLEIGGQFPLRVVVAPQINTERPQYRVYVEGRKLALD